MVSRERADFKIRPVLTFSSDSRYMYIRAVANTENEKTNELIKGINSITHAVGEKLTE